MARFGCKCGETLSNGRAPNDIELWVYTDREWDEVINIGEIDSVDLPNPKRDVWMCPKCKRVYVFRDDMPDRVWRVYALEEEIE